jgi:outer membrane lipoprotein-sorting protein
MTQTPSPAPTARLSRRRLLGGALGMAAAAVLSAGPLAFMVDTAAAAPSAKAQEIATHFGRIRTLAGEFVQLGPKGDQIGGKFYIERPGKVRFNYDGSSGFRVISDGQSVVLENPKMKTMDLYPLSKTPLKLLLSERLDLSGNRVRSVREEDGQTLIQLVDKSAFGNSIITLIFDPDTYELRQWTITDAQGKDTTVMVFNVQRDVAIDQSLFTIDYKKNIELNRRTATDR